MTPFLKELLLITNPNVLALADYLNRTALLFILPCFYMAMVCEYLTNWNFKDVIKRSFIAFLAIKLLTPLHVNFVNESLTISSQLVKRYSPQNKFLTAYNTTKMDKKAGVWKRLSSIVEMIVSDPIVLIIFLLSYIAFFLLTQLYSLVYHLGIVLIGVCAILSIFPITSKSLIGAIKTSLWCILMPFVVAIVLCLIGDSDAFLKTYSGGIVQNLESLIQLLIMTVILLMTPMITSKIMSDSGVASVAENIGQMAAMSTLIGGAGLIGGKAALAANTAHKFTTKPLIDAGKSSLSRSASRIIQEKGIAPKVSTLSGNNGFKANVLERGSEIKNAVRSTNLKEKITLAADSFVNKKENNLAKIARQEDASQIAMNHNLKSDLIPLSSYKREARGFIKKNQDRPFSINSDNFGNYRKRSPESAILKRNNDSEAFHFNSKKWDSLSPQKKHEISERYGLGKSLEGKDGYLYFPRDSQQSPVKASLYHRTMKPNTVKELRDAKSFLNR
jgi:type IV secretory pathway TrbL component